MMLKLLCCNFTMIFICKNVYVFAVLIWILLWNRLTDAYVCSQKDTEEEVKEHLRNNLHLQEKVLSKTSVVQKRILY